MQGELGDCTGEAVPVARARARHLTPGMYRLTTSTAQTTLPTETRAACNCAAAVIRTEDGARSEMATATVLA